METASRERGSKTVRSKRCIKSPSFLTSIISEYKFYVKVSLSIVFAHEIGYNHVMKTESVIINDCNTIREIEKKLEAEHVESMKQANEEIRKMLEGSSLNEVKN
jgi:hypothetical protein